MNAAFLIPEQPSCSMQFHQENVSTELSTLGHSRGFDREKDLASDRGYLHGNTPQRSLRCTNISLSHLLSYTLNTLCLVYNYVLVFNLLVSILWKCIPCHAAGTPCLASLKLSSNHRVFQLTRASREYVCASLDWFVQVVDLKMTHTTGTAVPESGKDSSVFASWFSTIEHI